MLFRFPSFGAKGNIVAENLNFSMEPPNCCTAATVRRPENMAMSGSGPKGAPMALVRRFVSYFLDLLGTFGSSQKYH